jgi:hypothetical protein
MWMKVFQLVSLVLLCTGGCNNEGGIGCQSPCNPAIAYPKPGACPLPGVADNQPGGKCMATWPDQPCVPGTQCVVGTCLPCGGADEVCCDSGQACTIGVCAHNKETVNTCKTDCGQIGKICCDHLSGCGNGVCSVVAGNEVCEAGNSCTGPNTYGVPIINTATRCFLKILYLNSTSPQEATTCAKTMLQNDQVSGTYEAGPINVLPTDYTYCVESAEILKKIKNTTDENGFSKSDVDQCMHHRFPTQTITDGECQ